MCSKTYFPIRNFKVGFPSTPLTPPGPKILYLKEVLFKFTEHVFRHFPKFPCISEKREVGQAYGGILGQLGDGHLGDGLLGDGHLGDGHLGDVKSVG